jgi:hypothetical protein
VDLSANLMFGGRSMPITTPHASLRAEVYLPDSLVTGA